MPLSTEMLADRTHCGESQEIAVSLAEPHRVKGETYPQTLSVGTVQHVLWSEPQIDLSDGTFDGTRHLTLAEAQELNRNLGRVLQEARQG